MSVEIRGKKYKVKKNGTVLKLKRKKINHISEIRNLESLSELKVLNLSSNQISEIVNLNNLKNLEKLDISSNKISEIKGLDECINLKVLRIQDNSISKINGLENLNQLEELDISSTLIEDLDNLDHLENLNLILFEGSPFFRDFMRTFTPFNLRFEKLNHFLFKKDTASRTFIATFKSMYIKRIRKHNLNPAILYYSKQPYEKRQKFKELGVIIIDDRTYYGLEPEKILQRIDEYFDENYFKEKSIYYPVEGITLIDLEVKNETKEEIIYSTLCKASHIEARGTTVSSITKVSTTVPIFITKNGIGILTDPVKNHAHIFPWFMFHMPGSIEDLSRTKINILRNNYTPVRDARFESEETFLERKKKFASFCFLSCFRYHINNNNIVHYLATQKYLEKYNNFYDFLFRDILHLIE
jgi:hypothetical protein